MAQTKTAEQTGVVTPSPRESWKKLHDVAGWTILEAGKLYQQAQKEGDIEVCSSLLATIVHSHHLLHQTRLELASGG